MKEKTFVISMSKELLRKNWKIKQFLLMSKF